MPKAEGENSDDEIRDRKPVTLEGSATLTGDLDTWDERLEAGRVALSIEGVWKVQNRLTVKGYDHEWEKWEYEAPYYYDRWARTGVCPRLFARVDPLRVTRPREPREPLQGTSVKQGRGAFGFNAATYLVQGGVIDPTKVVRAALQHAVSVASLLLTTEALVAEKAGEERRRRPPGRHAAHGRHGNPGPDMSRAPPGCGGDDWGRR